MAMIDVRVERPWYKTIPDKVLIPAAVAFLGNAFLAFGLGFSDAFWPVSVSAQLVGVTYMAAGIASFGGYICVILLWEAARTHRKCPKGETARKNAPKIVNWLKLVAIAALAGLYVDLTIVYYSFHFRPLLVLGFTILAALCGYLVLVTLPVLWRDLSRALKAVGISVAALAALAQFWYQSVYVPSNVPIGMNYTVTLGTVTQMGSNRMVQVDLTAEDVGAIPALELASMVVIRGITDTHDGTKTSIMRIFPLTRTGSFFFPDDTFTRQFVVTVTDSRIQALDVELQVDFARTNWLSLANVQPVIQVCPEPDTREMDCKQYPHGLQDPLTCPRVVQYKFYALESNLRRFTQGSEVVYSHWHCEGWNDKNTFVRAWIAPYSAPAATDLGIIYSSRDEVILLPKAATGG